VKGIITDVNIEGHWAVLLRLLQQEEWAEFWVHLGLRVVTFADLGLPANAPDVLVWRRCQDEELVLLTGNRNNEGPESLEAAIRTLGTPTSLPVFTIGTANRVLQERAYAERVIERLVDYLLDIDKYRGAGRLYLP
jgi:hypothetical protein